MSNKKSRSNTKKIEHQINKYQSALNLLFYEGQIAWQMNLLFIGLNVGIGTIIGGSLSCISNNYFLILPFSIVGILINIGWLGTFKRNSKYYNFRMAQARETEPQEWQLVNGRGYKFSKGQEVIIYNRGIENSDKAHKLSHFEKWASNKISIELAIWIFIGGFLLLFIISIYFGLKVFCN